MKRPVFQTHSRIRIGQYTYDMWQIAFGLLLLGYAILILATFRDYGITSDETHHVTYGEDIVRWYTSGFQDQSLFQTKNTYLYGGFFDTVAHLIGQALPLDRYDANHLCNALFGLMGIIAAYRIGTQLGGPSMGFLASLALLLTPRYYGHAFNNPKDIPFAVLYLCAIDFLIRYISASPHASRRLIIGTGIFIGLAMGVRVGGVLLIAYLILFAGLKFWQTRNISQIKHTLLQIGIMAAIAYVVMLICWPWALTHPLTGPFEAFFKFSEFTETHVSFFDGRYVLNTDLPRQYAPIWFLITLPEFSILSIGLGIGFLIWQMRKVPTNLGIFALLFSGLFPLAYAIVMRTPLYDGLRHLLFAMLPLVVFGAISVGRLIHTFPRIKILSLTSIVILLSLTAWKMISLHPNQYVYFNTLIAGGIKKASTYYETDYWENSLKQGIRWIETHAPASVDQKLTIGGFSENIQYMFNDKRFAFASHPENANFYLGTTRYDRHRKVPGRIVHIIRAEEAPILYIIHPDTTYRTDPFFAESYFLHFRLGEIHQIEGNTQKALSAFSKARDIVLSDERLHIFLSNVYIRIGNQHETMQHYDNALANYLKGLEHAPDNGALHNNIGVIYARKQEFTEAEKWFQKAIDLSPDYLMPHINLGDLALELGNIEKAQQCYLQAQKIAPERIEVLLRIGKLNYQLGKFDLAEEALQKAHSRRPNDAIILHELALARAQLKNYASARQAAERALMLKPDYIDAYITLGSIFMYEKDYFHAVKIYRQAQARNTTRADIYSALGMALLATGQHQEAREAFNQALQIDPNDATAKKYLPLTKP